MTDKQDWRGKKVTVVGLGIEGEDLGHYFVRHGAEVTMSDLKQRDALGHRAQLLERLGARLSLGANDPTDTESADLVCVSQGVPLTIPALAAARDRGVRIASMTGLFLAMWPGDVCGITGSSGKSTTASLVDAIFTAADRKHVFGGNIGVGLMTLLDEQAASDSWAVLEMSHTQLTLVDRSPRVACLTNVTPNHLDQFTWPEYVELKRRIFAYQRPEDAVVLNADDPVSRELRPSAVGRVFLFSSAGDHGGPGAFVHDGTLFWRAGDVTVPVMDAHEVPLRGAHNLANTAAAAAVAAACGIGAEAVRRATLDFRPPPHRLQFVVRAAGVDYYDDSIATTPERTLAALRSFDQPLVLLLGGRDKKLPLEDLAAEAQRRCRQVVCFGEAAALFSAAMERAGVGTQRVTSLAEAVDLARHVAHRGDVVLMSPAGTSFDAYENFERRGEHFCDLARQIAAEAGE